MTAPLLGRLAWLTAADHPDLLAAPVAAAFASLGGPVASKLAVPGRVLAALPNAVVIRLVWGISRVRS